MPLHEFTALLVLASAMSFSPGPNTTLSTALAANLGLRRSMRFVLAVPCGWSLLLVLCAAGIGAMVTAVPMLRWLIQENVSEVTANVIREDLVRFDSLPLVTRAPSVMGVAAGAKVRLAISAIDLLDVSFHAEYVETVAEAPDSAPAVP